MHFSPESVGVRLFTIHPGARCRRHLSTAEKHSRNIYGWLKQRGDDVIGPPSCVWSTDENLRIISLQVMYGKAASVHWPRLASSPVEGERVLRAQHEPRSSDALTPPPKRTPFGAGVAGSSP